MAATLTTVNSLLKRVYTPEVITDQLYSETPFLSRIEKTDKYSIGELGRSVIHVSRNGAYTALPDGAGSTTALNTAGNQGYSKAEFKYTHHHQQIQLDGDALDQTEGNSNALATVVDQEVSGAVTDLRRNLQRQLFLNGDALIARAVASTGNDVDLNYSGTEAIARGWIYVGMQAIVGTTASESSLVGPGGSSQTNTAVTAVGTSGFTNGGGAVTTEGTTHYVSAAGSRSGTTSYELNGLRNVISNTAVLGGLDPASVSIWKPANVDTTSQALTISLMLQQDQAIHQKTGSKADFVLTGLKQQRKFYELLQQQVRFSSDTSLAAGGQTGNPSWNGMEIIVDPDCWDEDMYFGQLKHLFILQAKKPYWQNAVTGGDILSWKQGYDAYVGKLTYRLQLGTRRRNAFARLGATADLAAAASGLS